MITGTVNADREAVIHLSVFAPSGQPHEVEAIVDTGFTRCLTLPPDTIQMLKLTYQRSAPVLLADGNEVLFNIYEAPILWDEQSLTIAIDEADSEPLVGMALLHGFDLSIRNLPGGRVTIERI